MSFDSHSELAFNISMSQLRSQKDDLRSVRNQAGMAAALAGLIATLFAGMIDLSYAMEKGSFFLIFLPLDFWFVILTFVGALFSATRVATSVKFCTFDLDANWILGRGADGEAIKITHQKLAMECEGFFQENESVISDARFYLQMSILFSIAQIPAWLCVLV
jgi:hypothetical protein